jgi:FkbM family methyltransferase
MMPRFNRSDLFYGLRHPLQAWRYLRYRDTIPYDICALYLPTSPVIVEAGAYDGSNTRDFCRFWPDCRVYAFEPVPSAYERMLVVAAEFPDRIDPQKIALGRRTETSEMHVSVVGSSGGEQSSSLLAPAATHQEFPFVGFHDETIRVKVTRLDEWAAEKNINRVDFLWLDLQGMELAALEGCGDLLATVSAIHCEVQNAPLYKGAPVYPEISRWLKGHGFRVAQEAVFRRGGNVLFVRRR